ncbi:hypothetical protein K438DRAFT_1784634 [Mycena galopus ATCC 62051]|nr:hypothetical protein K438DRAFT_1784634 [Mycena galopus ATCC 62051]
MDVMWSALKKNLSLKKNCHKTYPSIFLHPSCYPNAAKMPETQEATASVKQAKLAGNAASCVLERLVVDATQTEAKCSNTSREANACLLYVLDFRGRNASPRPTFAFHKAKEMLSISRTFPSNYALEFGCRTLNVFFMSALIMEFLLFAATSYTDHILSSIGIFKTDKQVAQKKTSTRPAAHSVGLTHQVDIVIGGSEQEIYRSLKGAQEICSKLQDGRSVLCLQAMIELREKEADAAKIKFQECLFWPRGKNPEIEYLCFEQLMEINSLSTREQHLKWPIIYLLYACKTEHKWALHRAFLFLGDVFIIHNDEDTAINLFKVSLAGFTEMDVHHSRALCMLRLGDLAKKNGCTSEAIHFWRAAQPLFARSLQIKEVAQIDSRLGTCENAHQQALVTLETLNPPVQLVKEISGIPAKDPVDKDVEEQTVPIQV